MVMAPKSSSVNDQVAAPTGMNVLGERVRTPSREGVVHYQRSEAPESNLPTAISSHVAARREGLCDCHPVGVFEIPANRKSTRDTGDADA